MPNRIITLISPIQWMEKPLTKVELREPKGSDYLDNGEPRIAARNSDGTAYWVEDKVAIKRYLDACMVTEGGAHLLRELSLADIRQVWEGLLLFFSDADQAISEKSSTL